MVLKGSKESNENLYSRVGRNVRKSSNQSLPLLKVASIYSSRVFESIFGKKSIARQIIFD